MWHLAGAAATKRLLDKTPDGEQEQIRRLNEAYAQWRRKACEGQRRAQAGSQAAWCPRSRARQGPREGGGARRLGGATIIVGGDRGLDFHLEVVC